MGVFDMKKKKKKEEFLREGVMSSMSEQQCMEKDWIFSDINLESRGCPMTNSLSKMGGDTVFC